MYTSRFNFRTRTSFMLAALAGVLMVSEFRLLQSTRIARTVAAESGRSTPGISPTVPVLEIAGGTIPTTPDRTIAPDRATDANDEIPSQLALVDGPQSGAPPETGVAIAAPSERIAFTMAAKAISPLSPGSTSELAMKITNPNQVPIIVESIDVAFSGTVACDGATNFEVSRPFVGPLRLPPGTTTVSRRVAPTVAMRNLPTNQDGCRDTKLVLQFTGQARRA